MLMGIATALVGTLAISTTMGCGSGTPAAATPSAPTDPSASDSADDPALQQIVQRCAAVEHSRTLPVSCTIDMVGDVARMRLTMANRSAASQYTDAAFQDLAQPFCDLANRDSSPAAVVQALYEEKVMRVAGCGDGRFGDWQDADPITRDFTAASTACDQIETSSYPINCGIGMMDDVPSLIVAYDQSTPPRLIDAILTRVGRPFCQATTASDVEAVVYLIANQRRAKAYNCQTGVESDWAPIQREPAPRSGPVPRAGTGTQMAQSVKYRHIQ